MTAPDLTDVRELVDRIGTDARCVIPILQGLQKHYRYLPAEALKIVCDLTEITPADIAGVSSFYKQFRHEPVGEHIIHVCHGTACHIKGAPLVTDALRRVLAIPEEKDTDPSGQFTLAEVACLGCCTLAPVVQIDNVIYGHQSPETIPTMLKDFLAQGSARKGRIRHRPLAGKIEGEVRVSLDSCCQARGSAKVYQAIERALADSGARATLKRVGCVSMCYQTPLVEIVTGRDEPVRYARVQPEDAPRIITRHFTQSPLGRLRTVAAQMIDTLLTDEALQPVTRYSLHARDAAVHDFMGRQQHLATEHGGVLDPLDFDEYVVRGGFEALKRCVGDLSPEQIIDTITDAGLRGRGGAGYPTGVKWSHVHNAPGTKYLICNCDEGDPGAFMDRMLLESYPFRIIEGVAIAARAVGARTAYFYIRAEYPPAIERISRALELCRKHEVLSSDLDLQILEGAGAFVCGEETALMAAIEGRRGSPRLRPPYPSQQGLWGRPTLINNVETYALVPWIIRNGPEAFAAIGTDQSKGTKVFALAGKVDRGGLIEVPMGSTITEVVETIGGGAASGHFKAVQIGGPSGGCVPASLGATRIDYEALAEVGAIMGSGGLIVLDDSDCMVDIARYFLQFTQNESCGKCTACRVGTRVMLDILEGLCQGRGRAGDIERLQLLGEQIKAGSLCALGGTAPNPVLSTIRYFRDEYEAHIAGRCPAGVCKALITYGITDECIGCTRCAQRCPVDAIEMRPYQKHEIDTDKCIRCGTCKNTCPTGAVRVY